ncbi:hypothetical protein [Wolbachia endosymbiont of Dactylopius coccus]
MVLFQCLASASYRHGISADPANKQRDDGCQGQRPYDVIPVLDTGIQFLI